MSKTQPITNSRSRGIEIARFIGRQRELAELHDLSAERGAQFLILYGRRRVGKTTLLLHWAQESGLPFVYWVANRLSPTLQLRSFSQVLYNAAHPDAPADAEFTEAAQTEAGQHRVELVDLGQLAEALRAGGY